MDDSIINFGKYRGYKFSDLSTKYLIGLYSSFKNDKDADIELMKYLKFKLNIEDVKPKEKKIESIIYRFNGNKMSLNCIKENKFIFASQKDAKTELRRIANINSLNKKPIRTYECEHCGGWHLTSKLSKTQLKFVE